VSRQGVLWINLVTGSRLVLALPVAVLTIWSRDRDWAVIASTGLVLAIELSDLLDGYLARRHGAVSPWGKVFDPYADSVSRLIVYWSLAMVGRCLAFVPLVMAIRDVTVGYARMFMMRRGEDVSARYTGKLKAMVQGVSALVLMCGPLYWGTWGDHVVYGLSFLVAAVTLASMVDYGRAALRPSA
jgi:CDP-diacylglycerol--glycerol-3-phosphate 3-phosphatidyltransferase